MYLNFFYKIFFILSFFCCVSIEAQNPIIFEQITDKSGRSLGFVTGIKQDSYGFLWVSTRSGLYRYDGYTQKLYKANKNDTNSLAFNDITGMFHDNTGTLWLRHFDHFSAFKNEKNYSKTTALTNIYFNNMNIGIVQDKQGTIWAGPFVDGIARYELKTNKLTFIGASMDSSINHNKFNIEFQKNDLLSSVKFLAISPKNELIVFSGSTILNFNLNSNRFENLNIDISKWTKNQDFVVNEILFESDSVLWAATDAGLLRMNLNKKSGRIFNSTSSISQNITTDVFLSLYIDDNSMLWAGSDNGIFQFHTKTLKSSSIQVNNQNRLYDNKIIDIFADESNNIWVATSKGLNKLTKSRFTFFDLGIESFMDYPFVSRRKNKVIWYHGKENNLNQFIREKMQIRSFVMPQNIFFYNAYSKDYFYLFNDIIESKRNDMYFVIDKGVYFLPKVYPHKPVFSKIFYTSDFKIGNTEVRNQLYKIIMIDDIYAMVVGTGVLYKLNTITQQVENTLQIPIVEETTYEEGFKYIKYILQDKSGNVWLKTSVGLYLIDIKSFTAKFVMSFDEDIRQTSVVDGNLCEDVNRNIWLAVMPYLYKINAGSLHIDSFYIKDANNIGNSNIKESGKGRLWIYTDNGLFKYSPNDVDTFKRYTFREGLAHNNINGVMEDKRGNLWITTQKGLSRLDMQDDYIFSYFTTNDLVSHNFLGIFNKNIEESGEVLFLTSKGFLSYFPDSINKNIPQVHLTRFAVKGEDIALDSLIYVKKYVELNYEQNFITIEFASLDYTEPGANQYMYMLQGLDDNWIKVDATNRRAIYTGLQPGEYTFLLKASNNDRVWNDSGVKLHIVILPPFYKTWWFQTILFLLTIAGIWFYIKWRERKLTQEKAILERKVQERTAEIELQKKKIEEQRDEVTQQRDQISKQKQEITESIHYASRIQKAILPRVKFMQEHLPEHFVLYRPKDIVSGDYYWMTQQENKIIFVAADCTGHGVPGALMSMLGISYLNQITALNPSANSGELLNMLRNNIVNSLNQERIEGEETKDGMDISLLVINTGTNLVEFAGAYNPLYITRLVEGKVELLQVKADRMPIGIYFGEPKLFATNSFEYQIGDIFYMFSDGYHDQFGGDDGESKFMTKRFKDLLVSIFDLPMHKQKLILEEKIELWKGKNDQTDDILVTGIRFA